MEKTETSIGKVVTFYSYKGGVGRSMALANIGVLLAKWGKKVLIIDWDLEAPGLEYFFYDRAKEKKELDVIRRKKGVIDLLMSRVDEDFQANKINWDEYENDLFHKVRSDGAGALKLITSGQKDSDYIDRVRRFNYSTFYDSADGGIFLEEIRTRWIFNNFDFVLIDSRTGLTESGGVCTIHMPDVLLLLFTPNEQSIKGVVDVATRSLKKHELLPFDRFGLMQLFIPTRFDDLESTQQIEWLNTIDKELTPLIDWLPYSRDTKSFTFTILELIGHIKIPYKAKYAYGERLAVNEEHISEPGSISYTYKTIAAIIGNNFASIGDLKNSRDIFVQRAKGEAIKEEAELRIKVEYEKEEKDKLKERLRLTEEQQQYNKQKAKRNRIISIAAFIVFLAAAILIGYVTMSPKDINFQEDKEKILFDLFKSSFTDSATLNIKPNSVNDIISIYNRYYKLTPGDQEQVATYKRTMDSAMRPVLQVAIARIYNTMPDIEYALPLFSDTVEQFGSDRNIVAKDIFEDMSYMSYLEIQKKKIGKSNPDGLITINSFLSDSTGFVVNCVENVYTIFPGGNNHPNPKSAYVPTSGTKPIVEIDLNYDLKVTKAIPGNNVPIVDSARVYLLWGNKDSSNNYNEFIAAFRSTGFEVLGSRFLIDVGRPDNPEIRYFNLSDAVQAEIISRYMKTKTKRSFPAVKYTDPKARPGYFEVWFGR